MFLQKNTLFSLSTYDFQKFGYYYGYCVYDCCMIKKNIHQENRIVREQEPRSEFCNYSLSLNECISPKNLYLSFNKDNLLHRLF